jgi:transposase
VKEMENDLSDFERGQIIGARLAGASVTKTATILGVSRATVSKVMLAYTNHRKTSSAKRSSGRKSSYTEKECFEKSQNYCNIGDSRTECSS